jgi:hypothetical protein
VSSPKPTVRKSKTGRLKKLICEVESDSEDDMLDATETVAACDPSKPWLLDFRRYIDTVEATPPSRMSTIQWWGVCNVEICWIQYSLINKYF